MSVFVRSTIVERPSSAEIKRTDRWSRKCVSKTTVAVQTQGDLLMDAKDNALSSGFPSFKKDCRWGARSWIVGMRLPK